MHRFKLGVGPMSQEIIDLLIEYSALYSFPLMIIASRNQVDNDSGYVCNTQQMTKQIRHHPKFNKDLILICRDHCGPYYSDMDQGLPLSEAMSRAKTTMAHDISCGFDLLHIDVSKIPNNQLIHAKEMIEFALSLDPNIMFEFGSEINTNEGVQLSLVRLDDQLDFLSDYLPNAKFFVTQTGSLTKHTQVGSFNLDDNRVSASKIHSKGFLFKEHNADYLGTSQVVDRVSIGIDAINIAPELGSAQTRLMCRLGNQFESEHESFRKHVIDQGYWKRWVTQEVTDMDTCVIAGGHYCFHSNEYDNLYSLVNSNYSFIDELRNEVFGIIDTYRKGLT